MNQTPSLRPIYRESRLADIVRCALSLFASHPRPV